MTTAIHPNDHLALDIELPWAGNSAQEDKFKKLVKKFVGPFMALLLVFPFISDFSDEPEADQKVVTQVILEQPKPIETEPPKPTEAPKQRTQNKKPNAKPKTGTQTGAQGMAALSKQLSSIRSSLDMSKLQKKNVVQSNDGQAKRSTRALLGKDNANRSSGGLKAAAISVNAKGATLAEHKGTDIESPLMAVLTPDRAEYQYDPNKNGMRDMESIRRVFERHKGAVYSLYNKALRADPELSGKFVFSLLINPDGSVANVKVVASDLGNKKLEQRFIKKIRTINFGANDVEPTPVEYTYAFIPS